MRELIFGYVRNIAFYIIFMNIILIMIPAGKYQGYIKTILGFVLILIMIKPAESFFKDSNGKSLERIIEEYDINLNQKEFEKGNDIQKELIVKQFEKNLLNQINNIIKKTDHDTYIEKVSVDYIEENGNIIGIENINIYVNDRCDKENIKNAISDFYNLENDNINIIEEIKYSQ